jgi:hypothetical protein
MTAPLCRCGQPAYPVRGGRCPCYYEGRASIFGESVLSRLAAAERVVEVMREVYKGSVGSSWVEQLGYLGETLAAYDAATKEKA